MIRKDERRLYAECERGALLSFGVALGREPREPKRAEGDLATPEGRYRISGAARPSRFHRFLPIDYPGLNDAEAGYREGRLSRSDYDRIVSAHLRGEAPPRDTPLGGGIGFHGEGKRWRGDSEHLDWTLGCIALSDGDLDFLIEHAPIGTPVSILGPGR